MEDLTVIEVTQIIEMLAKKPAPSPTVNLLDTSLIDSLNAVNLLVALEEKFNISLNVLDFADREQFTIARLAAAVTKAQEDKV